jgi:hypothetical protein
MTQFPHIPALHRCPDRGGQRVYALCGDLRYPDGSIAYRSLKTDGASRPWFLRKFLERFGRGFAAFILHDQDYADQIIPRKEADKKLRMFLTHPLTPTHQSFSEDEANAIYLLIRIFGWIAWRRNAKRPRDYFYCPLSELNNINHI